MTTAAVILAGGRGTRSVDPNTAKIAQKIGGRTLLEWHLELLSESSVHEAVLVTAHLAEQVQALADCTQVPNVQLRVVQESDPRGTFPALRVAVQESDADRFLVILGDIWTSFPIDGFLAAWEASTLPVAAIIHPSLHPQDSDAVVPQPDGTVRVVPKKERNESTRNMSATGVFAFTREYVENTTGFTDIGSHVLQAAAESNQLFTYVSSHYFKDTGTPDRLQGARDDWASGTFARRGKTAARPALLLDRDGVLNPALPEVYRPDHLSLIDGVAQEIAQANSQGIPVLVATNQPGLAKGFMTFNDHAAIRARLDALLMEHGAFIDDYTFCPHHPESGFAGEVPALKVRCSCRKPEPGLLKDLLERHRLEHHRSVMVGDSDRDEHAAAAADVSFLRVSSEHEAARTIRAAVEHLTC